MEVQSSRADQKGSLFGGDDGEMVGWEYLQRESMRRVSKEKEKNPGGKTFWRGRYPSIPPNR